MHVMVTATLPPPYCDPASTLLRPCLHPTAILPPLRTLTAGNRVEVSVIFRVRVRARITARVRVRARITVRVRVRAKITARVRVRARIMARVRVRVKVRVSVRVRVMLAWTPTIVH